MITEKSIEKTRFFTTDGTDIWEVKNCKQITELVIVQLQTGQTRICQIGDEYAKKFIPITMPEIAKGEEPKTKGRGTKGRVTRGRGTKGRPGGKRSASGHTGVYKKVSKITGKVVYNAKPYDKATGMPKYLGTFATIEEAAAAVEKFFAQQKGSNQSAVAWECNTCGHLHRVNLVPIECENCKGQSFRKTSLN